MDTLEVKWAVVTFSSEVVVGKRVHLVSCSVVFAVGLVNAKLEDTVVDGWLRTKAVAVFVALVVQLLDKVISDKLDSPLVVVTFSNEKVAGEADHFIGCTVKLPMKLVDAKLEDTIVDDWLNSNEVAVFVEFGFVTQGPLGKVTPDGVNSPSVVNSLTAVVSVAIGKRVVLNLGKSVTMGGKRVDSVAFPVSMMFSIVLIDSAFVMMFLLETGEIEVSASNDEE